MLVLVLDIQDMDMADTLDTVTEDVLVMDTQYILSTQEEEKHLNHTLKKKETLEKALTMGQ